MAITHYYCFFNSSTIAAFQWFVFISFFFSFFFSLFYKFSFVWLSNSTIPVWMLRTLDSVHNSFRPARILSNLLVQISRFLQWKLLTKWNEQPVYREKARDREWKSDREKERKIMNVQKQNVQVLLKNECS